MLFKDQHQALKKIPVNNCSQIACEIYGRCRQHKHCLNVLNIPKQKRPFDLAIIPDHVILFETTFLEMEFPSFTLPSTRC
jgi:hypothetical protein